MSYKFSLWDYRPWTWLFLLLSSSVLAAAMGAYYDLAVGNPVSLSNPVVRMFGQEFLLANQLVALVLFVVVFLSDIYYLSKGLNFLINHSGVSNAIDDAFRQIPVKCVDSDLVEKAAKLHVAVSPDQVYLPQAIVAKASPDALANIMCWLFYLRLDEIQAEGLRSPHTAFHSLADQLLEAWTYQKIMKFLAAVKEQKEYIGAQMEAAFDRRELERKVEKLQAEINAVILREQSYRGVEMDATVEECRTLLSGRSALGLWLQKRIARLVPRKKS